ncbi:MAG: YbaB/EbfC family nucleoid-associated protein [Dermatophilaceae bacterium]
MPDGDLDSAIAELEADLDRLRVRRESQARAQVVGRSADRTVEVRVLVSGCTPVSITFAPDALERHDRVTLAASVMSAIQDALQQAIDLVVADVDGPEIDRGDEERDLSAVAWDTVSVSATDLPDHAVTAWRESEESTT